MVRPCVFPGCSNKEVSWSPYRFHRVPLHDIGLKKQWLVTLNIDSDTPLAKLRQLRVCSDHFSEEDYLRPRPNKLDRHLLKRTAVPNHQACTSQSTIQEKHEQQMFSGVPKSTPKEPPVKSHQASKSASLKLEQSLPREPPSTSGAHPAIESELHDTWAVIDRPPGQVTSTGIQVNVPEMCTATVENRPTVQHIVDEEAILQLMKNCPMCDRKCRCTKRTCGPYFIVYQSCYFCNYQRKWANQPEARNMNIQKANTPPKKKLRPKNKVSVKAAKTQLSQLSKASTPDSSVSEPHCLLET
ncbi:THAP domain-containing protein 1-like isoform X3 [Cebidichthys violaceus]|uniref:THAP domain-containing protein 1-like isoform X3 n=1 Tax=Cebidichthys violaceus TaxID=271503 RepID=UPI0035CA3523